MKIRYKLQIVYFLYSIVTKNYDPEQTNLFTDRRLYDSFITGDATRSCSMISMPDIA